MDVIESSHFEAIKNWIKDHPQYELKMRSYISNGSRHWELKLIHLVNKGEETFTALQFGTTLKLLSRSLSLRS